MPTIHSMLSNDRSFPKYEPRKEGATGVSKRVYKTSILIKGGANVSNKHMVTKTSVETDVSDADLKALQESASFQRMVKRGFLSYKKPASEAVKKDASAPKTEAELKAKAAKKGVEVKLNTVEE